MSNSVLLSPASVRRLSVKQHLTRIWRYRYLYLLGLPGLIILALFYYLPMPGVLIAFQKFSVRNPCYICGEWIGFTNFVRLFNSPIFWNIFRNSLILSLLGLIFLFPAPIGLALLLNEVRSQVFKRVLQTVYYLPHFLSWVVVASLTYMLLSSQTGLINNALAAAGYNRVPFLLQKDSFYPLLLMQANWKEIGWGTIIYLAAISGVDPSLYEAAEVDGAGKLAKIWNITLPCILPTITVLFIMSLGGMLSYNFEQVLLMLNATNKEVADVIDTFVFRTGVTGGDYSYTTAVGLFKSVVALGFVAFGNFLAHQSGQEGLW